MAVEELIAKLKRIKGYKNISRQKLERRFTTLSSPKLAPIPAPNSKKTLCLLQDFLKHIESLHLLPSQDQKIFFVYPTTTNQESLQAPLMINM